MKGILGVDPGLQGALALIHDGGILFEPMPTVEGHLDLPALYRWLAVHRSTIGFAYLEQVSSRPGQGVSSTFKFGRTYGATEALLVACGIPYELVTPQKWQKVMLVGIEGRIEGKARCQMAASRLFPGVDLRASARSKKPHEGIVDALLLAAYGHKQQTPR